MVLIVEEAPRATFPLLSAISDDLRENNLTLTLNVPAIHHSSEHLAACSFVISVYPVISLLAAGRWEIDGRQPPIFDFFLFLFFPRGEREREGERGWESFRREDCRDWGIKIENVYLYISRDRRSMISRRCFVVGGKWNRDKKKCVYIVSRKYKQNYEISIIVNFSIFKCIISLILKYWRGKRYKYEKRLIHQQDPFVPKISIASI